MKKYLIMGGFDGKQERIALVCDSKKEAVERLNRNHELKRINNNLWVDRFNQEFSIAKTEY